MDSGFRGKDGWVREDDGWGRGLRERGWIPAFAGKTEGGRLLKREGWENGWD